MIWNMYLQNMKENLFQNRKKERWMQAGFRKWTCLTRCLAPALLTGILVCGCAGSGNGSAEEESDGKLRVVTTIFPQYDFVRQVAGDAVSLQMLLKPGEETHSYEPTPQDIIAIQKSDLFIYVGGENDSWVEDILESPEMEHVNTLRLVDCVDTLEEEHIEGMQAERGEHEHSESEEDAESGAGHVDEAHEAEDSHDGHVHEADEHVWTSPVNAAEIVEQIAEELCVLDEANALKYEQNAADYCEQLLELDSRFREVVEQAENDTLLFGDRFPFRYFAAEYGLQYYAAFSGCASDTEPSAATMAFLINKVREENIPVVLKMELSNENIANAVAEATGAKVLELESCHNLTVEQFAAGETYFSLMEKNVETLKEALGGWH